MKIVNLMMMLLLAGVFGLTGCGKEQPAAPVVEGVSVDLPKLHEAFATASAELQTGVSEVTMGVRYRDYPRAIAALGKLASAPGLTEPQKKILGDITEQIKQLASKAPSAPPR
jgi:hypothetical protein